MTKLMIFGMCFLLVSCNNYCRLLGEKSLGNNFSLVESDKDHINIVYCTSKPCCDVGIPIVPSKVVASNFNSKWIIAKSEDASSNNYWLIDKNFKAKFEKDKNLKEQILSHVIGPLDSLNFLLKIKEFDVALKF